MESKHAEFSCSRNHSLIYNFTHMHAQIIAYGIMEKKTLKINKREKMEKY